MDGAAAWGHRAGLGVLQRGSLHATTDAPQEPGRRPNLFETQNPPVALWRRYPQPRRLAAGVEPIVWDPAGAEWWPWEAVWALGTPGSDPVCVSVPDHRGHAQLLPLAGLGCPPEGSGCPQCPCHGADAVAPLILHSWCDLRVTPVRGSLSYGTPGRAVTVNCESLWGQHPCGRGKGQRAALLCGMLRGTVWLQAHPSTHCLKMTQFRSLLTHFMGFPLLLIYGKIALSHLSTKGRPESRP